jgi:hypothetical protein
MHYCSVNCTQKQIPALLQLLPPSVAAACCCQISPDTVAVEGVEVFVDVVCSSHVYCSSTVAAPVSGGSVRAQIQQRGGVNILGVVNGGVGVFFSVAYTFCFEIVLILNVVVVV